MWHQVQLVPCHTTYSLQPLTIHIILKSRHISCITLSHLHSKVHIYLFQLLQSIITPNILSLFSDTRNIQPLESSFVWGEPLACGWSVLCFLPLSLIVATCNKPSHPGCTSCTIAILQSCGGWLLSTKTTMPGCRFSWVEAHLSFCCRLLRQSVDHLFQKCCWISYKSCHLDRSDRLGLGKLVRCSLIRSSLD